MKRFFGKNVNRLYLQVCIELSGSATSGLDFIKKKEIITIIL